MTCPNCGAELEQHAFAHVCAFCGYISAKNMPNTSDSAQVYETLKYYEYIKKNIQYLKSHSEFVSIKEDGTSYEIQCSKAFHPLDGQYQLYRDLEFRWKAIVNKEVIRLILLSKGIKSCNGRIIATLDGEINIMLQETSGTMDFDEYIVPYNDFEAICNSPTVTFAFNEQLKYDEFRIYTHRFYNFVFDRTKYFYAINQHLLTD
ncbi:MAG: hypothetical protein PUK04_04865 [Bacteroidales bacterium]|nr:hypothetical protein [Bacteroidales bacterium]MDY4850367.1 hypothetical protein [Paludibacteraceae bacterium]MDY6036431.1 hypothetical protein [Paludibacteraceae bacterium]